MTPAERLIAERDRIQSQSRFYVTPCRMAHLMAAASKITDILIRADTNICYEECNFVLDIVSGTIAGITGEEDIKNDDQR